MNPKELAEKISKNPKFTSGHRLCGGCAAPIIIKTILASTDKPVIASNATGCLEVASTIYPYTSWDIPWIHSAFENAPPTISGAVAAYNSLRKRGKLKQEMKFVAFGGDGSSYDIGIQSLSGALERGENFVYVCYDNEAYCNTGGQRSGATPLGASSTTDPAGKKRPGKLEVKKDLVKIAAAHNIPYVAKASVSNVTDLYMKAEKAFKVEGPAVLVVLSTCPTLWGTMPKDTVTMAKMAVDSCFWPLYEVENGTYRLNYRPSKKLPVLDYLKPQRRFKHLFLPGNEHVLKMIQQDVDSEWEKLLELCGEKK
ncbi:MAG: pyruvate ferredoxin oxidoreductase [Candidatus Aenigmatarchaeota archaeon]|nr:MAG: pyruvate ferredoxin oxidoreductase [Candidatus Aenigmarchaeota archaeon]